MSKRRDWKRWAGLLLVLVLVPTAFLSTIGQASAKQRTPAEEEAKQREKEERATATKAGRELEKQQRREWREKSAAERQGERQNVVMKLGCQTVTLKYHGFPEVLGSPNEVYEFVTIHGQTVASSTFKFEGGETEQTIPIDPPAGSVRVDVRAKWNTNGFKGSFDIPERQFCEVRRGFELLKFQRISGGSLMYTKQPLEVEVGDVVEYEVVAINTGNVPVRFKDFEDKKCDPGTIAAGPGAEETEVPVADSVYFTCRHTITTADQTAGFYDNVAELSAWDLPGGERFPPIPGTSNEVRVTVVPPGTKKEKEPEGGGGGSANNNPSSNNENKNNTSNSQSTTGGTSTPAGKGGVLAFSAATAPSLKGPQGCVRSAFKASIKAAGVQSVTFYLDGHKLKTLTSKNAKKGLLTITIDPSKLKVGAHKLVAKITMSHPTGTKATVASRSVTVLRCHSANVTPKFTG